MGILNTSQRKDLADILAKYGFAADDFELRQDATTRACRGYGEQLKLKGSEFYFRIFLNDSDYNHEEFWIEFSPADGKLHGYDFSWAWGPLLGDFEIYLRRLKQETAVDDPWGQPGVARVVKQEQGQNLIPAGNEFTGQRLVRLLFAEANKSLDILDPYIGSELLDRLDDAGVNAKVRLLMSNKSKLTLSYFAAFEKRYKNAELRVLGEDKLHDRFIIVDGATAYHVGHSLKDLGKKDTHVSPVRDVAALKKLFEQRWTEAKPLK